MNNDFVKSLFGTYKNKKGIKGILRNFLFLPVMDAVIGFSVIFTSLTFIKILGWVLNVFDSIDISKGDLIYSLSAFVLVFAIRLLINLTYSLRPKN